MPAEQKRHVLKSYGNAHDDRGNLCSIYTSVGRAKCSCGWLGPEREGINAYRERRADHKAHKSEVTDAN